MEQGKSRSNSLLAFGLIVNFLLSVATVGIMVYKTQILEEQIFQLQAKSSLTAQAERGESYGDEIIHRRRRSDFPEEPRSCLSCHNACVKLFGLGSSAKVNATCVCSWVIRCN